MPGRLGESPNLVRAGIDDFAAKLIGAAEEVNLPQRGQWIRQGQKVWSFRVNGELVEMVSPIEGTVSDVNDEVVRHPESLTADPYGNGWLMTVQSPDAKTNFRNLLGGNMARNLIADSAKRLAAYATAGATWLWRKTVARRTAASPNICPRASTSRSPKSSSWPE